MSELPWPSLPALPQPQVHTSPVLNTAAECCLPANTVLTSAVWRAPRSAGSDRTGLFSTPHWPSVLRPLQTVVSLALIFCCTPCNKPAHRLTKQEQKAVYLQDQRVPNPWKASARQFLALLSVTAPAISRAHSRCQSNHRSKASLRELVIIAAEP